jgi:hypothetical protein
METYPSGLSDKAVPTVNCIVSLMAKTAYGPVKL